MRCATRCAECRSAEASTMRARSTCLRGWLRSATIAANWLALRSVENHTYPLCHGPIPQDLAHFSPFVPDRATQVPPARGAKIRRWLSAYRSAHGTDHPRSSGTVSGTLDIIETNKHLELLASPTGFEPVLPP